MIDFSIKLIVMVKIMIAYDEYYIYATINAFNFIRIDNITDNFYGY
jgi:hypothetical protein